MNPEELVQPLQELEKHETAEKILDKEIWQWLLTVQTTRIDAPKLHAIISDLRKIQKNNDVDRYHEKSPYYNIFLAYAYALSDNIEAAIKEADLSTSRFKEFGKEKEWQQAMSSWLYGLLLCEQGQHDSAKAKIDDAIQIISELADEQHHLGFYDKRNKIKKVMGNIENTRNEVEELKASAPKNIETSKKQRPVQAPSSNQTQNLRKKTKPKPRPWKKKQTKISRTDHPSGYIAIPWLPIFQSVSAGPNGIVIMDASSNADVTLNVIEIYDVPHNIYPIKKIDHQVTLNHIFTYGLVKVEGNSMNNAQPIHINDGDYVLFSKQQSSEENDIVIASHKVPNGDFAYMVKRYKKRDKLLVSESLNQDSSHVYAPIEINQDHQILGVVIAVAKAANK